MHVQANKQEQQARATSNFYLRYGMGEEKEDEILRVREGQKIGKERRDVNESIGCHMQGARCGRRREGPVSQRRETKNMGEERERERERSFVSFFSLVIHSFKSSIL